MRYFIKTKQGFLRDTRKNLVNFNCSSNARHYVINYCDLSDEDLEVVSIEQLISLWKAVDE